MKKQTFLIALTIFVMTILSTLSAQNYVEIGSGTESTYLPPYSLWNYAWCSTILNQEDLGTEKTISHLGFDFRISEIDIPQNNQKIYLKHTSDDEFADFNYENPEANGFTLVYDSSITWTFGWTEIDITDFEYNGTDNLIVHWENHSGSSSYSIQFNGEAQAVSNVKVGGSDEGFPTFGGNAPYNNIAPNVRCYYQSNGPATPANPFPENSAEYSSISTELAFVLGSNTDSYDIFIGTDQAAMDLISENETAIQGDNIVVIDELLPETTYFWQVIAKQGESVTEGPVWNFTTERVISEFPFVEDFESATAFDTFPQGWHSPETGWILKSNTDTETYTYEGNWSARAGYSHNEDIYLYSPKVNIESDTRVSFFWLDNDYVPGDRVVNHDTLYFEISINDGDDWEVLEVLSSETDMVQYEQVIINLGEYADNGALFRWRHSTDSDFLYATSTYIDYVEFESNPQVAVLDIDITDYTFEEISAGGSAQMQLIISNTGAEGTIESVSINEPFSVDIADGTTIPAMGELAVNVSFNPTTNGTFNETLTFNIAGSFEGINTVQLEGSAYDQLISLFENFDSSDEMPVNWSTIINSSNTTSNVWIHSTEFDALSGTNFVKMYNSDDIENAELLLITPGLNNLSSNRLSFWAKSSWGQDTDNIKVGTMTDPTDVNTFTELQQFNLTAEYQNFILDFEASNTDSYIAFRHGLGGTIGYSCYIEDVSWESIGIVPNPALAVYPENTEMNVGIDYIENNLITPLTWASGGGNPEGYRISIGTDNPPTNFLNNQDLGDVTELTPDFPLLYNTEYFWQIIPYNSVGDAEDCPVWSFTTMANPAFVVDINNAFVEGFEGVEVGFTPLGWESQNLNDDTAEWAAIQNSASYPNNAHNGFTAMHMPFGFVTPHDDWLYSIPLQLSSNTEYKFSFWYKSEPFPGENSIEKLEVKLGQQPLPSSMTIELFDNDNIASNVYTQYSYNFTPANDGIYFIGFHAYSDPIQFVLLVDDVKLEALTVSEDDNVVSVKSTTLAQNYPNPFVSGGNTRSSLTNISYSVQEDGNVSIDIFNLKGQVVKTLVNDFHKAGQHNISWNGTTDSNEEASSGIYFYRLKTNNKSITKKMLLTK